MQWRRLAHGLRPCLGLLLGGALLLFLADRVLDFGVYDLEVDATQTQATFAFDGQTSFVPLRVPINAARFRDIPVYERQNQIDGSDKTSTFTYDAGYFQAFSQTPYYRFQSLLRDGSSYDQWRDLRVTTPGGEIIRSDAVSATGQVFSLPSEFHLSVHIRRFEAGPTIDFFFPDSDQHMLRFEANRHDRWQHVQEFGPGLKGGDVATHFFPTQLVPQLATVLYIPLRAGGMGLLSVLALLIIGFVMPAKVIRLPDWFWRRTVPVLACCGVLAAGLYASFVLFYRLPHIGDAVSYFFGAQNFASFMLGRPDPRAPEAFGIPFTVSRAGEWFTMYPPGAPLVLAIGILLHVPWLVEPVMAAGAALLTYGIARRQYGTPTGLVAMLLMGSSPFLQLQSASFLSHVPAMFFGCVLLYGAVRFMELPQWRWAVLMGVGLGLLFWTREPSAALYALPTTAYVGVAQIRRRGLKWLPAGLLALGCFALLAAGYFAYNRYITGSPLNPPRIMYDPNVNTIGFGPIGPWKMHTPAAGVSQIDELLASLGVFMFGWPYYLAFALMAMPFVLRRTMAFDWLMLGIFLAFLALVTLIPGSGLALGPRYLLDPLPALVILAARGSAVLVMKLWEILDGLGRFKAAPRAWNTVALAGIGLLATNAVYFEPRMMTIHQKLWAISTDFLHQDVSGPVPNVHHALVVMDDRSMYFGIFSPLNCPRLDCDVIFAANPSPAIRQTLARRFADRDWYRLETNGPGSLTLEPLGAPRQADLRQPTFDGVDKLVLPLQASAEATNGSEPVEGTFPTPSSGDQGVLLDDTTHFLYDNVKIDPQHSTISVWVQPEWNGDDGQGHVFFVAGGSSGFWRLIKDPANNLRFQVTNGPTEYQISIGADLKAGDWHLITGGWDGNKLRLFIDGALVKETDVQVPNMQGILRLGETEQGRPGCDCRMRDLELAPAAPPRA